MRGSSVLGVMALLGCGPSVEAPEPIEVPLTCGGEGPVQLLPLSSLPYLTSLTPVDDRYILGGMNFDESGEVVGDSWAFSVDACAEQRIELRLPGAGHSRIAGTAGRWALASDRETNEILWLDPQGIADSHRVFADAHTCIHPIAGGLLTQDRQGTVWFHPAPDDPSASPRALLEGAVTPEVAEFHVGELDRCSLLDGEQPLPDGDGVLVAIAGGPLVRVSLPDGAVSLELPGPVGQVRMLEDSRFIVWRGGDENGGDCCRLHLHDRETGDDTRLSGGSFPGFTGITGNWISEGLLGPTGNTSTQRLTHPPTGRTIELPDWWSIDAVLSEELLLVRRIGDENDAALLDVDRETLTPVTFPPVPWNAPAYTDGAVAVERGDDEEFGRLQWLPSDGGEVRTLAEGVHFAFRRTQTGTSIFRDEDSYDGERGTLSLLTRDGQRFVIDHGVRFPGLIPRYGADDEVLDVLYVVDEPERRGLWRFALP